MPSYIVAIVGRPNVGKSTLYNRIIGSRDAIVFDTPGVTRDRKYGDSDWAGKNFTIIDTGGFVPQSDDVFERAIREQANIAIEEANAIIFMVDAVDGVHPLDRELSNIIRRSEKPTYLIVNKVDSAGRESLAAEFYSLGLGEPISIAALGGRGIGDFLDILVKPIKKGAREKKEPRLRLAVVGKPNVGKSSLVNALLGKQRHVVTPIAGTTRDPVDSLLTIDGKEIILVDTAGLRKKNRVHESIEFYSTLRTIKTIERCDVALVVMDAAQGIDKQDLQIVETAMEHYRSTVVAVNKWDLVENKETNTARQFEEAIREKLGLYDFLPIIFISALTKQRIAKVVEIAERVREEQRKKVKTSQLNNTLLPEIERNPPKSSSPKEIKIKYVTQVKSDPPVFAFFCNEPTLVQESYRRYLENRLRDHFGYEGVPLRVIFKKK